MRSMGGPEAPHPSAAPQKVLMSQLLAHPILGSLWSPPVGKTNKSVQECPNSERAAVEDAVGLSLRKCIGKDNNITSPLHSKITRPKYY